MITSNTIQSTPNRFGWLRRCFQGVPLLCWLLGALAATLAEQFVGLDLAHLVDLPKIPVLFGFENALKKPDLIPGTVLYILLIYVAPALLVGLALQFPANRLAGILARRWPAAAIAFHLALLYAVLHIWSDINDYRVIVVKITLIAVMLTLSLNVIKGYMGEFSCSLPGFMALGAYAGSIFTIALFTNSSMFGKALHAARHGALPLPAGPFGGRMRGRGGGARGGDSLVSHTRGLPRHHLARLHVHHACMTGILLHADRGPRGPCTARARPVAARAALRV